jgi:NAD(P)H dehydrogenase (quinone)
MATSPLLVTGASGQLGRNVLELLLETPGRSLVATTRNPDSLKDLAARGVDVRKADFDDEASLREAFRGAGRALLVSYDHIETPGQREAQHEAAIRAFAAAGVGHVVYTSLPNPGPGSPITIAGSHRATEEAIAGSGLDHTILRNNLYVDLALGPYAGAVASGKLVDARGRGAAAFITREDCARAAAAALASGAGKRTLDIGGGENLTSDAIAALLAEITGKAVVHVDVPPADLRAGLLQHGLPGFVADLVVSFDAAIAAGQLETKPGPFEELTGRRAQSIRAYLEANRARLVG